jgi:site-specific recombinase XerD
MFDMASLYKKPVFIRDPRTGERVKTKSKKWWGRFRDVCGREKRVPLATDKSAAAAMLREWVVKVERESAGVTDPFEKQRNRPIREHLADYKTHLIAKGNTAKHARITAYRVGSIIKGCRFTRIGDISASRVQHYLANLRAGGRSVSCSNHYLRAMKMFTRWLVRDRRATDDALAHLSMLNADLDIRRQRRTLDQAELTRLIQKTKGGKSFRGLTGQDRAMLYLVALNTGLRSNELASLTASSFDLDAESPTVTVEAAYSKHRRRDVLPLRGDVVLALREYLGARGLAARPARLWARSWYRASARMLRIDLKAAGIAYQDQDGRVFDFHALRHQFISNLARAGVHPKAAQALARHSTITLTLDRYTHVDLPDLSSALDRLPAISCSE